MKTKHKAYIWRDRWNSLYHSYTGFKTSKKI